MNAICFVIKGPTVDDAIKQLKAIEYPQAIAEIRIDWIQNCDLPLLKQTAPCPLIFTLRSTGEGGNYSGTDYEEQLLQLAELEPEYLDVEHTVSKKTLEEIKRRFPKIKIILSYHNFKEFPSLDAIYEQLTQLPADLYKIAAMVNSSVDALQILIWMKNHPKTLVIGMGVLGTPTRILGPIFGAPFTFSALNYDLTTAPGQLTLSELDLYHYGLLNHETKIYGLIGEKISLSPGRRVFNSLMDHNAVYMLFPLQKSELEPFMECARKLKISGLSITMPFKELVIPFLDELAAPFDSVNTFCRVEEKLIGFNTDGIGAIDVLEPVLDKRIIIMGAGGSAKAIASIAISRGAYVTILNRTPEKAKLLAEKLQCQWDSLENIGNHPYDILVNTTSIGMPIPPDSILPRSTIMDISLYPFQTQFLEEGAKRRCHCINGLEMWINQAMGQWNIWFGEKIERSRIEEILDEG